MLEREKVETLIRRELEDRQQARRELSRVLQTELRALAERLELLEAAGRDEEASEVESVIDDLRRRLDSADRRSGAVY